MKRRFRSRRRPTRLRRRRLFRRKTYKRRNQYTAELSCTLDLANPMTNRTGWATGISEQGRFAINWLADIPTTQGTDYISL